jgi:hypothetical protein
VAAVHAPVAIGIFEHHDASTRCILARAGELRHEATHLDRIETTRVVPGDGDRRDHQRLGSDELDAEARRYAEARLLLLGREHRRGRDFHLRQDLFRRGRA